MRNRADFTGGIVKNVRIRRDKELAEIEVQEKKAQQEKANPQPQAQPKPTEDKEPKKVN